MILHLSRKRRYHTCFEAIVPISSCRTSRYTIGYELMTDHWKLDKLPCIVQLLSQELEMYKEN